MPDIQEKLIRIFTEKQVMDILSLKKKFKNRSVRSIFRDLSAENYFSSFTHAGKHYTLKNIPRFNSDGLWFYQEIGFAKFGTLKNTISHLIGNSEAGKTHDELKIQLHIRVHNTLLDLVKTNKIIRKKIKSDFVYFSINSNRSKKQMLCREKNLQEYKETGCPDWIVIEILVTIIRITKRENIDSSKVALELAQNGKSISKEQVEVILHRYHLKKTLDST